MEAWAGVGGGERLQLSELIVCYLPLCDRFFCNLVGALGDSFDP